MKKTNTNTIGSRIKEMRLKKGMTQEQLAEQLCTTKPLISQYENNKIDIKSSIVVELAEIVNTTAGYLVNGEVTADGMDEQMKELMQMFNGLGSEQMKRVALEQMKVLVSLD